VWIVARSGRHTKDMPDRAIIPALTTAMAGFIGGTITAVTQTYSPQSVIIGVILGFAVFASGFVSVIKAKGEESERWIVGAMRGAVAAACFGFLFAGILTAVRDGKGLGLLWLLLAAIFAVLLTRFRVRDRGQLDEYGGRGQPTA
jgi:hypothetical protein